MDKIAEHLSHLFGEGTEATSISAIVEQSKQLALPAGAKLFATGDACENFVMVIAGRVRVQLSTKAGREITLFKLEPGQSCALTTSCLLSNSPYYAEGIAETDVKIVALPSAYFHKILKDSPKFMHILLGDYALRIAGLTGLVDRLTSRDLNAGLADFLLVHADEMNIIQMSHKAISVELRSAREVISRKLKDWEHKGWIRLKRGAVLINDRSMLENLRD